MHSALLVDEILRYIIFELTESVQDLLPLTLTCKSLSKPALEILWETAVFRPDSMGRLSEEGHRKLFFHARHARNIYWVSDCQRDQVLYQSAAGGSKSEPRAPFPHLKHITIKSPLNKFGETMVCSPFLTHSLLSFDVRFKREHKPFRGMPWSDCIQKLSTNCPRLKRLHVEYPDNEDPVRDPELHQSKLTSIKLIQGIQSLRKIGLPSSSPFSIISYFSTLPNLESLSVWQCGSTPDHANTVSCQPIPKVTTSPPFPRLQDLYISTFTWQDLPPPDWERLAELFREAPLRDVMILLPVSNVSIIPTIISILTSTSHTNDSRLSYLTLGSDFDISPRTVAPSEHETMRLEGILTPRFQQLVQLCIDLDYRVILRDDDLVRIGSWLPRLRELKLKRVDESGQTNVTMLGIFKLALCCPELEDLRLSVNLSKVEKPQDQALTFARNLQWWNLSKSDVRPLLKQDVAMSIARLFPSLGSIGGSHLLVEDKGVGAFFAQTVQLRRSAEDPWSIPDSALQEFWTLNGSA